MASNAVVAPLLCALFLFFSLGRSAFAEEYIEMVLHVEPGNMTGPNPTSVTPVSTSRPTSFGSINMRDRSMADGPGADANVVGRVLDAAFKVTADAENTWYTYMTLAIKDSSRFSGSTLQVGGLNTPGDAEWAILGGTGKLTMARGIVRRKQPKIPGALRTEQLNVYAYYTPMPSMEASGQDLVANL